MSTFLTVGTSSISEDLFLPVQDSLREDQFKPFGGLWLSPYDYPNYNEWVDYLITHGNLFYFKNPSQNPFEKEGALVTLKNDAKIFLLNTLRDLETLQSLFPHPNSIFSYEALSHLYDGILVDPFALDLERMKKGINSFSFHTFCVKTLLLFNLNAIAYYQSAQIGIKLDSFSNCKNWDYQIVASPKKEHIIDMVDDSYLNELCLALKKYLLEQGLDYLAMSYLDISAIIYDFLMQQNRAEKKLCRMLTKKIYS